MKISLQSEASLKKLSSLLRTPRSIVGYPYEWGVTVVFGLGTVVGCQLGRVSGRCVKLYDIMISSLVWPLQPNENLTIRNHIPHRHKWVKRPPYLTWKSHRKKKNTFLSDRIMYILTHTAWLRVAFSLHIRLQTRFPTSLIILSWSLHQPFPFHHYKLLVLYHLQCLLNPSKTSKIIGKKPTKRLSQQQLVQSPTLKYAPLSSPYNF